MANDFGIEKTDYKMNHLKSFFLVCSAGIMWSFGALIIRYMVDAQVYQWQYLFFRGLIIALVLILYLAARERINLITKFQRIGISGFLGAFALMSSFVGFIWSVTYTMVANTMFILATAPFFAAFLGIVFLKEKIRSLTWIAMFIALVGIFVMVIEGLARGNLFGNIMALISALGFAVFSVSLRWRKETPQFATIALAGLLCAITTILILLFNNLAIAMPLRNVGLSILHGSIVGFGLILFASGAKFLPAAELILLTLIEVIGGVLWVYLPIFGIHEVPSQPTLIGGGAVLFAIILDGVGAGREQPLVRVP